jgi:uncharacterized protein (TIGR02246 family)
MSTSAAEQALRQVIATYQGYVNAGDTQGDATLFTDDIVWMPPNAPDRVGRSEVFNAQGATFNKFKLAVELTPTEVRLLGQEWGLVLVSVRGSLTPRGRRCRRDSVPSHVPDGETT